MSIATEVTTTDPEQRLSDLRDAAREFNAAIARMHVQSVYCLSENARVATIRMLDLLPGGTLVEAISRRLR